MLVKLSESQARVYFTIKKHGPIGPTKIGNFLEYDYDVASQTVTRPLRTLVRHGLVVADRLNKRVVKYSVVHEIDPPFLVVPLDEADL